jgi:hypothetical protein
VIDLKLWAGVAGPGMHGGLSVLTSLCPLLADGKLYNFLGPPLADISYIIIRRLVLADGNYISSIGLF